MEYALHLAILVGIYALLAQSLNLTFGLGRLLNLGHIATYALGAYATALLSTELQLSVWLCIPLSMLVAALASLCIGAISLKLSDDYFAIGTLAFSSVVGALLINWKSLTKGVFGISGIPRPELANVDFYENRNFLLLVIVLVILSHSALYLLFRGSLARKLRMHAEHTLAAEALGSSGRLIKNQAFVVSSFFAGLAGSLYAYYINYIDPSSFGMHEMVLVLSIVIVGCPGSFYGVLAATVFLILLPEPLRFIEMNPGILGPMRQLLYALILFAVIAWRKDAIFPARRTV